MMAVLSSFYHAGETGKVKASRKRTVEGGTTTLTFLGLLVVAVIVALVGVMLWSTQGVLTRAHEIVLFVSVAIVTGVLFWILTPGSSGQLTVKQLGIRLGGGAGIGASFMLLAWWLTASTANTTVVPVPFQIPTDFTIENISPEHLADVGELRTVSKRRFIYAEFRPGHNAGVLRLKYLKPLGGGFEMSTFTVTLAGELSPAR
jgi:hypothetical protein